jgi:hypothetical protein
LNKYNSALKYLMIVCLTPLLTYLLSTGQSQSITTCRSSPAHCADSVVWLLLPIQNVLPDVIDCFLTSRSLRRGWKCDKAPAESTFKTQGP